MSRTSLTAKQAFYIAEAGQEAGRLTLYANNKAEPFSDDLVAAAGPNGVVDFDPDAIRPVHDANGDVTAFTWDEEDQLVEVNATGVTTRYVYDFEGRRLVKQDPDGTTYYVGASYEIFVPLVGDQRHTKYVPGPLGKLVQITRTDVTLVSMAPDGGVHTTSP